MRNERLGGDAETGGLSRREAAPDLRLRHGVYRDRGWHTRAGAIPLRIPKLRSGRCFPALLEPRGRGRAGRPIRAT